MDAGLVSDFVPATRLEVRNGRQWRAAMRKAGRDMSEWKDIHRSVADTVIGSVNAPTRTGRLAGSVRGAGTVSAAIVRVGRKTVPYAMPIHWGWPSRGIRGTFFVTGAAKATEPAWTNIYWQRVTKVLDTLERETGG